MFETYLTLIAIHIIAVISPGPDFALVTKYALLYDRKTAQLGALGIALGMTIHLTYSFLGIGFLLKTYPWILGVIRYLGAAYLFYIGASVFFVSQKKKPEASIEKLKKRKAFGSGFLTNVLNPKATIYFLSVFSQVFIQEFSVKFVLGCGLTILLITVLWFSLLAFLVSRFQQKILKFQQKVELIIGLLFLIFAIKLAFY